MRNRHRIYLVFSTTLILLTCSFFDRLVLPNVAYALETTEAESSMDIITDVDQYDTNEIIVTYKNESDSSDLTQTLDETEDTTQISDQSVLVELDSQKELAQAVQELSQDDNIASIQPNYTYQLLGTPTDTYYSLQWGLSNNGLFQDEDNIQSIEGIDINVSSAWDTFTGGRSIVVAVIDTGIDYKHEDLKDVIWTNTKEIVGDGKDNDSNGYIDDIYGWNFYSNNNIVYRQLSNEDNHGTHVAGIIGAAKNGKGVVGVASNTKVKIMPIKALGGAAGEGDTASIIKAIKYAEKNGAKICNLSLGSTDNDPALREAIQKSTMLFVCASGNGEKDASNNYVGFDIDATPMYPAAYEFDNIVSVANITCRGVLHSSSNYGLNSVDVAAPGTTIVSTIVGGKYNYMTGTSMATPMVSGVISMVYSYYDGITITEAKNIVLSTTKPLPALASKVATGGTLDAFAALSLDDATLLSFDQTAPKISSSVSSISKTYRKNLKVTVKDPENNLTVLRYAKGTKTKEYFNKGEFGTKLSLTNSSKTFTLKKSTTYTIYARDLAGNERIKTVTVSVKPPTKITTTTKKTIRVGRYSYLKSSITPSTTKTVLTYKSSNTAVATVNKSGKIVAKKKGTVTITVTTENGLTARCRVTVTK